jgi:carbon-monoxide dehydrogenase medium subunit
VADPEIVIASSVEQAVALLAEGDTAIVCGGTSHALRRERSGYPFAKRLVAIRRIPELNMLRIDENGVLHMGAAVCQETLFGHARLRSEWQAISDALEAVGHTRIRQMITVGGSIGPLIGGFDLPIALLALEARVTVAGSRGRRTVSLREAFDRRFARDEMVVSVAVDPLPARTGSSFIKYMARGVLEIPTVNMAARVALEPDGTVRAARVAAGAVSSKPIVLDLDELAGERWDVAALRNAVQKIRSLAQPISDVRGSAAYKREMAVEFAHRALLAATRRALAREHECMTQGKPT